MAAATRDAIRFWSQDQSRWAVALHEIAQNMSTASRALASRNSGGGGAADAPHHSMRDGRARSGDFPTSPTVRIYYRTSPGACDAFCKPPHGAPRQPLDPTSLIRGVFAFGEYTHQVRPPRASAACV